MTHIVLTCSLVLRWWCHQPSYHHLICCRFFHRGRVRCRKRATRAGLDVGSPALSTGLHTHQITVGRKSCRNVHTAVRSRKLQPLRCQQGCRDLQSQPVKVLCQAFVPPTGPCPQIKPLSLARLENPKQLRLAARQSAL